MLFLACLVFGLRLWQCFGYHRFGYHQNHLKVFGCLDSCFCVFMWIIIEFFTKRSRSPSLQSFCGPFWELEKWSNCVKLGKIQKLLQKNSIFFFFDIFSICFRFFVVRLFFSFLFSILVGFSRFWIKFDKIQKLQKTSSFFSLFSFFFELFSNRKGVLNWFSNYVRIPKTSLKLFSKYFRIKTDFLNYFRTWSTFWFCFPHYQRDCHSDLGDPGKICCNKLKVMFWEHSVTMEP